MARQRAAAAPMTRDRMVMLRESLSARRRDLVRDIHGRIREGRAERPERVHDQAEDSDADIQEDLAISLLEMRSETLRGLDDAIARLDAGQYGFCVECRGHIAAGRLSALPFAVRCRACEELRERGPGRGRPVSGRRAGLSIDLGPTP